MLDTAKERISLYDSMLDILNKYHATISQFDGKSIRRLGEQSKQTIREASDKADSEWPDGPWVLPRPISVGPSGAQFIDISKLTDERARIVQDRERLADLLGSSAVSEYLQKLQDLREAGQRLTKDQRAGLSSLGIC